MVQVQVEGSERLKGKDGLTLKVKSSDPSKSGEWKEGYAQLSDEELAGCDADILGDVVSVSPEAACVDKDDRKVATFTYEVEVDESNVDQDFEYEFVVPDDVGDYKFAKGEVSGAESTQLEAGSREGKIRVGRGETRFVVQVQVEGSERLKGKDGLTLKVKSSDPSKSGEWKEGYAQLSDEELAGCDADILGDVVSVSPEAACVDKDDRKVATFTYEVEVDESNVDQDFEYEFVVPDDVGDYKFAKGEVSGAESTQLEAGSREGKIRVGRGETRFVVQVQVEGSERLKGKDGLTLKVKSSDPSKSGEWKEGYAQLSDEELAGCDADILGDVVSVSPEAACVDKDDRKVATFTYEVEVDESNVDQDFEYEFVVPDDVGDYKFAKRRGVWSGVNATGGRKQGRKDQGWSWRDEICGAGASGGK